MIGLCVNQKDNRHPHIQLTVDLIYLDKIIPCQSFHGDYAIHVWPHSNVLKLVQNYTLPVNWPKKLYVKSCAICKVHQSTNCTEVWYFRTKSFFANFLRAKRIFLDIKWSNNHWSTQRMRFIHVKVLIFLFISQHTPRQ